MLPFPPDAYQLAGHGEIDQVQADQLSHPQAAGIKEFQDGPVPDSLHGLRRGQSQDGFDLREREKAGRLEWLAGSPNQLGRVPVQMPLPVEVAEEGPQYRQFSSDGHLLVPRLAQPAQELPDGDVIQIGRLDLSVGAAGSQVAEELLQVAGVARYGVGRVVLLESQMGDEGCHQCLHELGTRIGQRLTLPPRAAFGIPWRPRRFPRGTLTLMP